MYDRFYIKVVCRTCGHHEVKAVEHYVDGIGREALIDAVDHAFATRKIPIHKCHPEAIGFFEVIAAALRPEILEQLDEPER